MQIPKKAFADLAGVSPAAVSIALKAGRLVATDAGLIDTDEPANAAYLAADRSSTPNHRDRREGAAAIPVTPPAGLAKKGRKASSGSAPAPAAPAARIPPAAGQDGATGSGGSASDGSTGVLSVDKLIAEIALKREQAGRIRQQRLERQRVLIERAKVERVLGALNAGIKSRLLDMPRRVGPRLGAMARSGEPDQALAAFLEAEITEGLEAALQAVEAGLSA